MMSPLHGATDRGGLVPPRFTLLLSSMLLALYVTAGAAPALWVYDRAAIATGEWWRLLSAHLVHSDGEHLLWNLAALLIIGFLLERRHPLLFLAGLLAGIAAVNVWLWFGLPGLQRYCGLSGVLNTWLVLLLFALWREARQPMIVLFAVVSAVKLVVELWSEQALFSATAWPSVPSAHLAGVGAGLAVLLYSRWLRQVAVTAAGRGETTMLGS